MPTMMPRGVNVERDNKRGDAIWQMWHQNGTRCPKGTVPIRRSKVHDVLRAKSLYEYGKKPLSFRHSDAPDVVSGNGHEVRALSLSLFLVSYNSLLSI